MAKPTTLPRWANVGGDIEVPISGKLDLGFVGDEEPPAQYLNWLFNIGYDWDKWLDDNFNDSAETKNEQTHLYTAFDIHQESGSGDWQTSWMATFDTAGGARWQSNAGGTDEIFCPLQGLVVGQRITEYAMYLSDNLSPVETARIRLFKYDTQGGSATQVGTTQTSAGDGSRQVVSEALGTPEVVVVNYTYYLVFDSLTTPTTGDIQIYGGHWKTDRA